MSYQAQAELEMDPDFRERNRACCVQQASQQFSDHIADAVLKDDLGVTSTFIRLAAAGPGIAEKAQNPDGSVDQSRVTDADILALAQANWPTVAELYPQA